MGNRLFIVLFCFLNIIVSVYPASRSYTYMLPDDTYEEFVSMNLNLNQNINPKAQYQNDYYVCVNDTENIADYVEYAASFSDMKIVSYCDKQILGQYKCNEIYYYKINSYGMSGPMARLSAEESKTIHNDTSRFTTIQMFTHPPYLDEELKIINKILTASGGAWMKAAPNDAGIKYANNNGGIGCTGVYKIQVTSPNGGIDSRTGGINKMGESYNFKFSQEGNYSILYETSLTECGGFMEERVKGDESRIHPFVEKKSGTLPFKVQNTLKVQAVPSNRVRIDDKGGYVDTKPDCQGMQCDATVPENNGKTVRLYLKIKNVGDVDVFIKNISVESNSTYLEVKGYGYSTTPSGQQVLQKNKDITYILDIALYAKKGGSENNLHDLRVSYDYEAKDINPCNNQKESGTEWYDYKIAIVSEPLGDDLNVPVAIEPPEITVDNYKSVNENGIKIKGNVTVLSSNLVAQGANVTLLGVSKYLCQKTLLGGQICQKKEDCLGQQPEKVTDKRGGFEFNINKLGCEIGVDETGYLKADVKAEFMGLVKTNSTNASVATNTPPLKCRINIDKINRAVSEETYDFSVELVDKHSGINVITPYTYDCGDGNGQKNTNDLKYSCTYKVDESTPEVSKRTMFQVNYEKDNDKKYSAVCTLDVGLCQVYIE
ncbi:MAG: hypothetical protein ACP5H8_03700 [Candidatus Micrarchaeia archaeon]